MVHVDRERCHWRGVMRPQLAGDARTVRRHERGAASHPGRATHPRILMPFSARIAECARPALRPQAAQIYRPYGDEFRLPKCGGAHRRVFVRIPERSPDRHARSTSAHGKVGIARRRPIKPGTSSPTSDYGRFRPGNASRLSARTIGLSCRSGRRGRGALTVCGAPNVEAFNLSTLIAVSSNHLSRKAAHSPGTPSTWFAALVNAQLRELGPQGRSRCEGTRRGRRGGQFKSGPRRAFFEPSS